MPIEAVARHVDEAELAGGEVAITVDAVDLDLYTDIGDERRESDVEPDGTRPIATVLSRLSPTWQSPVHLKRLSVTLLVRRQERASWRKQKPPARRPPPRAVSPRAMPPVPPAPLPLTERPPEELRRRSSALSRSPI